MARVIQLLVIAMIGAIAMAAESTPVPGVKEKVPELDSAEQLILVTSESWAPGPARLQTFERRNGAWEKVGEELRASIGKKGIAWGVGLHGSHPIEGPVKREGDGKSPAGVFGLDEIFGSQPAKEAGIHRFPYRQVNEFFAGVDDSNSRHYNRIVDPAKVAKDWNSAESMVQSDGTYRLGCVVRHNWRPYPGFGSCIFLHIWKAENVSTSGCTAMASADLERVLQWLDEKKRPVFVQLPAAEYARWRPKWGLP